MRDVWTFDVASRIWSKWLDIPAAGAADIEGEGNINASREESKDDEIEAKMGRLVMHLAEAHPVPWTGAGFVLITTGTGREYLLLFMGQEDKGSMLKDVWSFQVASDKETLAILKDGVRRILGKQRGEEIWVKAKVVESTKKGGPIELPNGPSRFGYQSFKEFGSGAIVIWGGSSQGVETAVDHGRRVTWVALLEAMNALNWMEYSKEPPDTIMIHMSTREHTVSEAILAESVESCCMVV